MGLFSKKKDTHKAECCCCGCGGESVKNDAQSTGDARIKVLGSGCPKCNALEAAVKEALDQLGMDEAIEHVKDYAEMAKYGVMSTPALVIDGKVVSVGKVLKKDEVVKLLEAAK
jgi:small redox-active disulfide protein 2